MADTFNVGLLMTALVDMLIAGEITETSNVRLAVGDHGYRIARCGYTNDPGVPHDFVLGLVDSLEAHITRKEAT